MLARVAHAMAMESPRVSTDIVGVHEFPDLARRYNVMGVPKTVINDSVLFTGAVSEDVLLERIRQAVEESEPDEADIEQISDLTTPLI